LFNNVIGTLVCAQTARLAEVKNFVLVSTDKAVRPTNMMGASKRVSEMVVQAIAANRPKMDSNSNTIYSIVRFGNVLDSSGSVVPIFREQIKNGGPLTVTHPEVTRFFMTIPEAAQLVIQAGALSTSGEVFLLDMGQPVKIYELAQKMLDLSGLTLKDNENPDGDIGIEITGLKPGEKLYEELLIGDNPLPTSHPMILKARENFVMWSELEPKIKALEIAISLNDVMVIRHMLKDLVAGYEPSSEVIEWIYHEESQTTH
jgi:FlaA1/EpsC-like NDP-sugar epimerase